MELKALLSDLDYTLISGKLDIDILKICYDSRTVTDNSVFIAIKGFKVDGHKFVSLAIQQGAKAIVVEELIELPDDIDQHVAIIKMGNTRYALSKIASNYYGNPSKNLKIIGITGTNGKTSTSLMLKNIFASSGKKVGVIGTIGNFIGDQKTETKHTTPESLELQGILADMVKEEIEYVIMEVSSHALQLDRVANIHFHHSIFTNLTQDHLDFHKDMDSYFNEKKKLFFMSHGVNIINTDDPYGNVLYEELLKISRKTLSYGLNQKKDVYAKDIEYSITSVAFTTCAANLIERITCPIPGKFSVYNLLSAITVAIVEGIHIDDIKSAVKQMPTVPGRIERIEISTPYEVIIDFAHTPDGLKNVLNTLKEHVKGRLITLFGCGGDRDKNKRPIMGKIAGELSEFCIVTTDNPRSEEPLKIIEDVLVGIKETDCEYIAIIDRREAIEYALSMAKKDDVIVLAGKGHETYQVLRDQTIEFNEKQIVKEYLGE